MKESIVFILAHPDDEHIPFGLPTELANKGNDVYLLSLTKGDLGSHRKISRRHIARIRKREFAKSGQLLGAKETRVLGFSDGDLDMQTKKARRRLLTELRKIGPDIVIVPNHADYHQDHQAAHAIGKWATFHLPDGPLHTRSGFFRRKIKPFTHPVNIYEADTQGSQTWQSVKEDTGRQIDNLSPINFIFPLSEASIAKSMHAFAAHKSQLSPRTEGQISYPELARRGAIRRGGQGGFPYGAGLTFLPFGGYAFSTNNKLEAYAKISKIRPLSL